MRYSTFVLPKLLCAVLLFCFSHQTAAQTQALKLTDFAVWGGSASSSSYNSTQGVFISNTTTIQGNIGSNHRVDVKTVFNFTGDIYSGNAITLGNTGKVTGNVFAAKIANNYSGNVITGDYRINFTGNISAKGKVVLKNQGAPNISTISGQVAVPAPSSANYSGPAPALGIVNTPSFPVAPVMPNNTSFDSQVGTATITSSQILSPGKYRRLALNGNKTLTFNGPGNYIFNEVDNGATANKLIFDFNNTSTGTINIFIIKDAKWGKLTVSMVEGNFPSRIYTEVHGTGSTNSGNAFSMLGPASMPSGSSMWLGNVWAPNGVIAFKTLLAFTAPHVIGALWSGKKVELDANFKLVYQAPAVGTGPGFIDPAIAPPPSGKVSEANNPIGAELSILVQNPGPVISLPENNIFTFDSESRVLIEVIAKEANDNILRGQLEDLGMKNEDGEEGTIDNGPHIFTHSGFIPVAVVPQLIGNDRIKFVRPLFPPISNSGIVTSQGDATMRSDAVRSRFGLDGSGVKIGVISDSYDSKLGAQADVNEGDLPGVRTSGPPNENPEPVQVVEDLADRGNDEGRAMLQIVHDVAPKAKLAFHTGFLSAGHFAQAIQKLAALPDGRCDVIVDDLTYITEPFQRDGVVAQAVNEVVSQGVTYFSSAGNFGNRSYEAVFNGVTNTAVMPSGQIHRFGATPADIYQTINLKPGSYTIGLQWSDEFSSLGNEDGVQTDMDMYIMDANGFQLFGFNRSNISGDPFEHCAFTVRQETNAKIMIVRASGTVNVRFKYIIFRGEGTIVDFQNPTNSSTIVGHPNADGAIAVGAMLYDNIPGVTTIWPGVASFSSRGGTFTFNSTETGFMQRSKPELVGPNGVNTTVNLGGAPFNDGDTYPNFFGTSAAAPHVAAVGALIIQGRKKFNLQTTVTPLEVRNQLQTSAGQFSYLPGNFSFEGGYGFVMADSAVQQIANPKPIFSSLGTVVPDAQFGTEPFVVKLEGKYFTGATQIYMNNAPIATNVSINASTGVGTATATIPAIATGQDPLFSLFNPAKSVSEEDGGFSEALQFFSSGVKINIRAENKSRKYGQENPTLTAKVSVIIGTDTNDIGQTSLTLAELKLDDLTLATNATTFSSPRSYGITVARTTPLEEDDPLLEKYTFEFLPGALTVERMPLKITPVSKTVKYGDDISGVNYTYEVDQNGVVSPNLLEEIKSLHKQYLSDNGLIVIQGYRNQSAVTSQDLVNMSAIASFQSVLNARKFIVENGQLKSLTSNITLSQIGDQRFIVDVSTESLQNYKLDNAQSTMVSPLNNVHARALLSIKALTNGSARASTAGGDMYPMVNGQLVAMVNGQLQALVNGQLKALVNGLLVDVNDIAFQNGQLLALVNGIWNVVPGGQIVATVDNQNVTVELSAPGGELQAVANGIPMTLVGSQLQATVNGQLLAVANGQLKAVVNGQLTPLINQQLTAIVNGELQPVTNGQVVAIVNGQLLVSENGELEIAQDISLINGQLKAIVNGQLKAIVNGQLKAMVNGVITDVETTSFTLLNGQLRAVVNGQTVAYVNGQLKALVNGQLKPFVNGEGIVTESVIQIANGQLKALVNGFNIPIANGQLQAMVNGQLLAMVNGQLMAVVNGEVNFVVFQNGQLKALVNGQLVTFEEGQLSAIVNGQLQDVDSYTIVNGQLRAVVNAETWVYPNGQLKALVNGQLQALVNNFDVSGTNNNAKTVVLVDEDDINLQFGDVGGMLSMNMVTGLEAGSQIIIPGAFVNGNYDVTYGFGSLNITKKPLNISAEPKTKNEGEQNPLLTVAYDGFAFDETPAVLCQEIVYPAAVVSIDQLERRTTYTDIRITGTSYQNDTANVYRALPGEGLLLTGNWNENHLQNIIPGYQTFCPFCITQNYVGMTNNDFSGNQFDSCYDVSGTGAFSGTLNTNFTAPTRPGIYYITQNSSWYFTCYQFGHLLHDQAPENAIAVVIVEPSWGITATTTATEFSTEGDYPIIVGGCYFNPNYRIIYKDDTLTVNPAGTSLASSSVLDAVQTRTRQSKLYPNPASSMIRLNLANDVQSIHDIQIHDAMGRLVAASSRKQGEGFYEINVSRLKPGIYMIKARTTKGVETFKFIKM